MLLSLPNAWDGLDDQEEEENDKHGFVHGFTKAVRIFWLQSRLAQAR